MVIPATIAGSFGIIDAAAGLLTNGARVAVRAAMSGGPITNVTNQTTIVFREFIDESIVNEPIIANFNKSVHGWYVAQILSALHLSRMIGDGKTVQSIMGRVQSGHNDPVRRKVVGSILGHFSGAARAQESFVSNYLGDSATESLSSLKTSRLASLPNDYSQLNDKQQNSVDNQLIKDSMKANELSVRPIATGEHRIGPMGEMLEVKLTNPNGNGQTVTVPVFVQMNPSLIQADVAPRFIDMHVSQSLWQRWTMWRAGEISFVKDFILQRDLAKRQRSVLKDPQRAAAFTDFLKTIANKDAHAALDAAGHGGISSNLTNSVMIFSEDTVAQAKVDSGIDLHNEVDRKRYFRETYSMIIAVIDPLHQRVTVYFNGIDGEANYAYSDFRPNDQRFDPKDFMSAMQAFSTNSISRLR